MSKFNWRNGFAVGLAAGLFGSVAFFVAGDHIYHLVNCIAEAECTSYTDKYEDGNKPQWWYWTRRLIAAEDTLAQWVMAVFTIAAVMLVWRTLAVTRNTLTATQTMARDTKAIGDRQVAASVDAVNAARDANQVAAQQFRAAFKPWISVEMKGPFLDMREKPIRRFSEGETERIVSLNAETHIHCIGDIPATIENFDLRLMEGPDWPYVQNPPHGLGASSSDFFSIMQKGDTLKVDPRKGITDNFMSFNSITLMPENRRCFMKRPPPITGHVIFSDPMGVRYEHRFAFVAKPTWGDSFTRYGGREHNGEREID